MSEDRTKAEGFESQLVESWESWDQYDMVAFQFYDAELVEALAGIVGVSRVPLVEIDLNEMVANIFPDENYEECVSVSLQLNWIAEGQYES